MTWPFRNRRATPSAGRSLYDSAVRQSRIPALYTVLGAPDTVEGRFEVLTLHVILLIERLRTLGPEARDTSQTVFDSYLSDLDGALREMGVGDLAVGKRMRSLGRAFYGRATAYRAAFAGLPDRSDLQSVIWRTVLDEQVGADPAPLAAYAIRSWDALAQSESSLLRFTVWPAR